VVVEDQQNMNIRRKTCFMYVLTPSFTTGAPAARWPPTSFCPALAPLSQYNQRIFIYDVQEADGGRTLQPGNNHNNKKNVESLASESISLADTVRPERPHKKKV
jgi:hypothetical protein